MNQNPFLRLNIEFHYESHAVKRILIMGRSLHNPYRFEYAFDRSFSEHLIWTSTSTLTAYQFELKYSAYESPLSYGPSDNKIF